jgi:hypothetical protein|eukprot:jgi/Chrpa1/5037/Chrysochromulina_OHIO_Genome00002798-RA
MSDEQTLVVAVATLYQPGSHDVANSDAVTGVAVGRPLLKAKSFTAPLPELKSAAAASSEPQQQPQVASSFLYTPRMAKVFAQFDIDGSGALDLSELTKLIGSLGLSEEDAAATLNNLGGSADKKIKLEDWEHALDDRLRGLIEASLNEQGRVVGTE